MKLVRLERRVVSAEAKYQQNPTHHRAKILKQRRRLLARAEANGATNADVNTVRMLRLSKAS